MLPAAAMASQLLFLDIPKIDPYQSKSLYQALKLSAIITLASRKNHKQVVPGTSGTPKSAE